MKTDIVKNFMTNFNFNNENWSVKDIKNGLKQILGEEVGVEVSYEKDVKINEMTSSAEEISTIGCINLTYTDDDDKIKTIKFNYAKYE